MTIKKRKKFLYRIMTVGPTNRKSVNDECIVELSRWPEVKLELRKINSDVNNRLAYVQFRLVSEY